MVTTRYINLHGMHRPLDVLYSTLLVAMDHTFS